ncbi:hypothetical protein FMUND_10226 [Fusarium mundagurra]|uniref:Uncharacterized protein n=1 Tax=Fusarium mundagurra TaxID=1567541 RepID=A0A8H6D9L1_9HYPO|nr:hypothetical protein FMUND_10226 [Fusarium mundagurra]
MNNFASGAIPNTRVTMRPNLTAGLFLNGRSSTYGRGADITLNDMTLIGTCGEKGKADEIPQYSTSEDSSGQDDVSNSGHTSRSATELPRTTTNDEEGEVQSLADDFSQVNQQNKQKIRFEAHSGSLPSTETTQASDCETPEAMLKRLIETGIFDGTGILGTTSHRTMEPNIEHHDCPGMNETKQSSKNPTYQDKGCQLKHRAPDTNKNCQFRFAAPPHKFNLQYYQHRRGHPLSRLSERGHSYTEPNDRPELMFPSLIAEDFNGEQSYHQDSTGKNESQLEDSFVRRGLQSHGIMIPVSGSPGFQQARRPLNGHISSAGLDSAVFPTVHSEIYWDHRHIQHDKMQLTQPDYCEGSETIQELIKRIEGEVSMKWDNSQQSFGVGCISDIEECAQSESFEMDNSEDLSQCSDIEYDEAIQQSLHGNFPSFDQGSISANQVMAEDWEHTSYQQSRYWGGNYHDEHGVPDAKMIGFWRPNHF